MYTAHIIFLLDSKHYSRSGASRLLSQGHIRLKPAFINEVLLEHSHTHVLR